MKTGGDEGIILSSHIVSHWLSVVVVNWGYYGGSSDVL